MKLGTKIKFIELHKHIHTHTQTQVVDVQMLATKKKRKINEKQIKIKIEEKTVGFDNKNINDPSMYVSASLWNKKLKYGIFHFHFGVVCTCLPFYL